LHQTEGVEELYLTIKKKNKQLRGDCMKCLSCGYKTLDEEPSGTYDICEICFWEDDGYQ
jgi:hypothetical protein